MRQVACRRGDAAIRHHEGRPCGRAGATAFVSVCPALRRALSAARGALMPAYACMRRAVGSTPPRLSRLQMRSGCGAASSPLVSRPRQSAECPIAAATRLSCTKANALARRSRGCLTGSKARRVRKGRPCPNSFPARRPEPGRLTSSEWRRGRLLPSQTFASRRRMRRSRVARCRGHDV
eukprot:362573-Chlamydomonas_euryale.AAC.6